MRITLVGHSDKTTGLSNYLPGIPKIRLVLITTILFCVGLLILFFFNSINIKNVILTVIISFIPAIFLNPRIGFALFIISLPITTDSLIFYAGFHIFPSYILFGLTFLSCCLNHLFGRKIGFKRAPMIIPFFIFLLVAGLSVFQSTYIPNPSLILYNALRNYPWIKSITRVLLLIFLMSIMYFTTNFIQTKKDLKNILTILLISTTFFSILGLVGFFIANIGLPDYTGTTTSYDSELPRIKSIAAEPIFFGGYLLVFLPILLLLFISHNYVIYEGIHLLFLGTTFLVIFLTFSRSVWLALFFLISSVTFIKRKGSSSKKLAKVVILLLIFIPFILPSFIDRILIEPIKGAVDPTSHKFLSTELRLVSYKAAFEAFAQHPFLGIGLENFNFYSGLKDASKIYGLNMTYNPETINSLPLKMLTELGLIGFIVCFWLIIAIIREYWMALNKNQKTSDLYNIVLGGLIGFVCLLIQSFFLATLYFPFVWFFLGLNFATCAIVKNEIANNENKSKT